jgi:hypothetical protein
MRGRRLIKYLLTEQRKQAMQGSLRRQLYACGSKAVPGRIVCRENTYRFQRVLKHDFFAATALYELCKKGQNVGTASPPKIVLKLSREQHFLGLPLTWLGELLCSHQIFVLRRLSHLRGTPHFICRYGKAGLIYRYIEGNLLDGDNELPDDFFDEMLELLRRIHGCNIVYLDMNKRDNIILGSDGRPYLIDFQISLYIGERALISRRLSKYLRDTLKKADIYHLFKHKRKLAPESLRPEEQQLSRPTISLIQLHRLAATPLRKLRRALLKHLKAEDPITTQNNPTGPP